MRDALQDLKEELVASARRAYEIGLQTGNGGNLSGRVPGTDQILIKPSGYSFGELTPENLVTVYLGGEYGNVGDERNASRELRTHLAIYQQRPDVHGIFHSHSPWSIAYAHFQTEVPTVTLHAKSKLGQIPVLNIQSEGSQELARAVQDLLTSRRGLQAFVQTRHGIFSFARTVTLAQQNAELVEETAHIAWLIALGNLIFTNQNQVSLSTENETLHRDL